MSSPLLFHTILLVSDTELNLRRDRQAIMKLNASNIKTMASAHEAFDYLGTYPADLVICDTQMLDMDSLRFLQLLRQNMNLKRIPVVMVTMENSKNKVLDAISAGVSGYVLRPYSLETFERHLRFAHQVETQTELQEVQLEDARDLVAMGDFDEAIEAFEEIVSVQDDALKYFDMGCQYLMQRKWGRAIIAFKKAIRMNELFAEAYKGLADAYRGKGDADACKSHLQKAADIHAQFDRLEETKKLFIEILKYDEDTPNPFNSLGVKLRREGDYMGAIHAYEQAAKLTPKDENIYYNMAKAYYFMGDKETAMTALETAMRLRPSFVEAGDFLTRVREGARIESGCGGVVAGSSLRDC